MKNRMGEMHHPSQVTIENRQKVMCSLAEFFPKPGDFVQGHIFEGDGCYRSYWMKYDPERIAKFICLNDKDKLICNGDDYAILNTEGKRFDFCIDDVEAFNCLRALGKLKEMNISVSLSEFEQENEVG